MYTTYKNKRLVVKNYFLVKSTYFFGPTLQWSCKSCISTLKTSHTKLSLFLFFLSLEGFGRDGLSFRMSIDLRTHLLRRDSDRLIPATKFKLIKPLYFTSYSTTNSLTCYISRQLGNIKDSRSIHVYSDSFKVVGSFPCISRYLCIRWTYTYK